MCHNARRSTRSVALPLALVCLATLGGSASRAIAAKPAYENVPQVPPAWTLQFAQPVVWQRVTPLGTLIVNTSGGLSGVDPESGKVLWTRADLSATVEEKYEDILGTPFVIVGDAAERNRVTILDTADGRVVFDSAAAGFSAVLGHHVFPRAGTLLVVALRLNEPATSCAMYDIATGVRLWITQELNGASGKFMQAMLAFTQAMTRESGVGGEPLEIDRDTFVILSAGSISKVATRSGRIVWKTTDPQLSFKSELYLDSRRPDLVVAGAEIQHTINATQAVQTYFAAYRLSDGGRAWKEPVMVKGGLNAPIFTERGLVISPRTADDGRIKLIDYASGESLWGKKGKGIEVFGGIVDHDVSKAGIVLTTGHDSAWNDKGVEYFLNVLDVEGGVLRFKDPVKVKGRILDTEALANGILFITTSEAGILDLASGQPLSAERIESKDSLITARSGKYVLAFSAEQGTLFLIDKEKASIRRMSRQPVQLEGDDSPISLEIAADLIVLASNQSLVGFGRDGSVKFHAHHPAPRQGGVMRALLIANALRAGMAAFATGVYSGAFASAALRQEEGSAGRNLAGALAQGTAEGAQAYAGLSGQYWKAAKQRFSASAVSGDFAFIMVQMPRGECALAAVSKRSGEVAGLIPLGRDREPSYSVDTISNRVYYRLSPNEIVSYRPAPAAAQQARSSAGGR
jgi:outer membrane protein assembly factor BamB